MAKQLSELSEHRSNHPGYQWVLLFLYITDVKHKAYGTKSTQQRLRPGPLDRFGKVDFPKVLYLFLLIKTCPVTEK